MDTGGNTRFRRVAGAILVGASTLVAARFTSVLGDTYPVWLPALYEERVVLAQALLAAAIILGGAGRLRTVSIVAVVASALGLLAIEGAVAAADGLGPNERFVLEYAAVGMTALTISMGAALCGWRTAAASAAIAIALLAAACLPGLLQLTHTRIRHYELFFRKPLWSASNRMSYICVAGCALAAPSLLRGIRQPRNWLVAVPTFAACGTVLLLAKSRGAMLALAAAAALLAGVAVVRWVARGHPSRWAAAALVAAVACVVGWEAASTDAGRQWLARNRLQEPADEARESRKLDQSIDQRAESWDRGIQLFSEAPLAGQSHSLVETEKVRGRTLHTWYGHLLGGYGLLGAALVAGALLAWLLTAPRWYGVPLACFAGLAVVALSVRPELEPIMGVLLALGAPPLGAAIASGTRCAAREQGAALDSPQCAASRAS